MPDKEFTAKFLEAIDQRTNYYNSTVFPQLLEQYRLLHTCVKNIIEAMIQKSIIKPDPYKLEKKISDIEPIINEQFIDSEKSLVIGTRVSDYEAMLDFISTYYKFSLDNMNFAKIKTFVEFNSTFMWGNFSTSNPSPNTRGLALLLSETKYGAQALTVSTINDNLSKCDKTTKQINTILKELNEFQKEVYKAYVRKNVFDYPKFDTDRANASMEAEIAEIKKHYNAVMGKIPYYTALIEEIAQEDLSPNRQKIQANILSKLKVNLQNSQKKEKSVDTKEILMQAVHALSGLAPQLEVVASKISENHKLLQNENNSFFAKLARAIRKAFSIAEPPVIYEITITDSTTGTKSKEKIEYTEFYQNLIKKINFFNSFSLKQSPGYQKIEASPSEKILDFLNKQLSESQKLLVRLNSFDEYFKASANNEDKKNIKGLKMELTSLKNTIVNTNQHRADYISFVEEQNQLQKLGISNEN
ncbi:MAG: hypothetical protein KBT21_06620 [Treponema sp.]|nr:hypothetical protein [Candidatus Treponema merdequi]